MATRKVPISANKKTTSIKTAQGSSLLTPVSFNAHKRRRPPSLQNSPVEVVQERNNTIPIPAEVPLSHAPHTETTLSALVQGCPGRGDATVGSSLQVQPSMEGKCTLVNSSGLKHEPASLIGENGLKDDNKVVSTTC
ncbi:hypothetical protein PIB30_072876 [Stylosanthes scabra]|uniref:Uncharacterized protein n=1 Tax=Stylosanthes scabra TaxID=79078 RepID=A0ABU6UMY2_9FABA|nr:hypothetical protein [Stylosanthes scabra]